VEGYEGDPYDECAGEANVLLRALAGNLWND
jgi:hypothetical protein